MQIKHISLIVLYLPRSTANHKAKQHLQSPHFSDKQISKGKTPADEVTHILVGQHSYSVSGIPDNEVCVLVLFDDSNITFGM